MKEKVGFYLDNKSLICFHITEYWCWCKSNP